MKRKMIIKTLLVVMLSVIASSSAHAASRACDLYEFYRQQLENVYVHAILACCTDGHGNDPGIIEVPYEGARPFCRPPNPGMPPRFGFDDWFRAQESCVNDRYNRDSTYIKRMRDLYKAECLRSRAAGEEVISDSVIDEAQD